MEEDILSKLKYCKPIDIWKIQQIWCRYCYANNIDLSELFRPY